GKKVGTAPGPPGPIEFIFLSPAFLARWYCLLFSGRGVRSIERWRVCGKHLLGSGFCAAHLVGRSRNLYSLSWRADVAQDQGSVRWPCSHLCDPRVREASASDRLGGTPKGFGCLHCS